jgi:hypothetical protein
MTHPTRNDIMIKLDAIDTALEAPDADRAALMRDAESWLAAHPVRDVDDSTYYNERLQAIRERHKI